MILDVTTEWSDAALVVVDDEALVRESLGAVLRAGGYDDVRLCADGEEALGVLEQRPADLVLLDLHLPGGDGRTVLRELSARGSEGRIEIPVLMLTGSGDRGAMRESLALGAADFLHKPIDATELLLRVRNHLRVVQARRRLASQNDTLEDLVAQRAGELALLSRVLDEIPVPVLVLRDDGSLRYRNAAAGAHSADVAAPDPVAALVTDAQELDAVRGAFSAALGGSTEVQQVTAVSRRGPRRYDLLLEQVGPGLVALLLLDVEAREATEDALRRALDREVRANARLREVERLRDDFVTAVSHEVRTPLTVVLGVAELLARAGSSLEADKQQTLLERLQRNAVRLERLLADLLHMNHLEGGRATLRTGPQELPALVAEAVEELGAAQGRFVLDVPEVVIEVDGPKMRRVLRNLLRNAVVHTPPDSPVRVRGELADDLRLAVVDHGPGVPEHDRQRIFERFEQGGTAPVHSPGTGIGLTVARSFVELHDGSLELEDTPGGGATFVIRLPARRVLPNPGLIES